MKITILSILAMVLATSSALPNAIPNPPSQSSDHMAPPPQFRPYEEMIKRGVPATRPTPGTPGVVPAGVPPAQIAAHMAAPPRFHGVGGVL